MLSLVCVALLGLASVSADAPLVVEKPAEVSYTSEPGYSVKTGYEGYLVPANSLKTHGQQNNVLAQLASMVLGNQRVATEREAVVEPHNPLGRKDVKLDTVAAAFKAEEFKKKVLAALVPHKLSKLAKFKVVAVKLVVAVVGVLVAVLFAGGLAAAVCAFTPLCTISLVARENVRSLMTSDKLSQLTSFVLDSFDKYRDLQRTAVEKA